MRGTEFAEMTAFVAIAERCSFAKAATHLGVARSTLSQNIRALEERLRVRLLNRTTRSVSLTEAGEQLLARVRPALGELAAAANELKGSRQGPTGLLRLAVQPPVASFLMGPLLGQFLSKYPGIRLDISVVKMPANIFSEGFDAGIRFGEQVERDMIAMRVTGEARFVVVASPEYLARFSVPRTRRICKITTASATACLMVRSLAGSSRRMGDRSTPRSRARLSLTISIYPFTLR